MQSSIKFQFILRVSSFLVSAIILYYIATTNDPRVFVADGVTIPVGNDSFYHLKRIADVVNAYPAISDFDPDIYAPEGSWLIWPKGFDFLMATIAKISLDNYSRESITRFLSTIPQYIGLINIFLLYVILRFVTESIWIHTLTLLIYALSPLTRILHTSGMIDHHSFEHLFVLLSFIGVLLWYKKPDSVVGPIFSGIVMGVSQIFHAGLFILQLPILLFITISYIKNERDILKGTVPYGIFLLSSTILVSLSSSYFYNGMMAYYFLGWFHIYIAGLTSAYLLLLTRLNNKKSALLIIALIMCILALPLLNVFIEGFTFMRLSFPEMQGESAVENKNIFGFTDAGRFPFEESMTLYSGFPLLIPIIMIFNIFQCIKGKGYIVAWGSYAVIFMTLFNAQFRFQQYGSIFLFVSILMLFKEMEKTFNRKFLKVSYYTLISFLIFIIQSIWVFTDIRNPYDFAMDYNFRNFFDGLIELKKFCKDEPGIVLSDRNAGHYITYYTNCSVFSNNFNHTPFQWQKTRETEKLFRMSLNRFKKENKFIKYIFTTRSLEETPLKKLVKDGSIKREEIKGPWWRQMRNRLLYTPQGEDIYFTLLASGEPMDGSIFKGMHPFWRIYKLNPDSR